MSLNLDHTGSRLPRQTRMRIMTRRCPDPSCDGQLVFESVEHGRGSWRCDGLTYATVHGPLVACDYSHLDGDEPQHTTPSEILLAAA